MYEIILKEPKKFKIGKISFSSTELIDLLKAWAAISVAFAIVMAGGFRGLSVNISFFFGVSALTVGVGFLLHELAHKVVAQRYHCWAEFRADNMMLILAVAMSLFGFVFAAPGAVMIYGNLTKNWYGRISAAGPLMNILIGFAFLGGAVFTGIEWLAYGFVINGWLALFNMIPLGNFDGIKIWRWSKPVYLVMLAASGAMFIMQFLA